MKGNEAKSLFSHSLNELMHPILHVFIKLLAKCRDEQHLTNIKLLKLKIYPTMNLNYLPPF